MSGMRRTLAAALVSALLLVTGCSAGGEKATPEPTPLVESTPVPSPAFICEPLAEGARAWFDALWGSAGPEPVQVRAGEGKRAGEIWYVVTHGDRQVLTDAPGKSEGGQWIDLSKGWGDVNWDADRLARGQAALSKAVSCHQDAIIQAREKAQRDREAARREREAARANVMPDPAIVATMTCKPLSKELLDKMRFQFGTPTRSVQVEAGEGLDPGSRWWIVISDSPPDDAYPWGIRRFLTNAPGSMEPEDTGRWIPLPASDTWVNVSWDRARLTRAQSALVKAEGCLGAVF